MHYRNGREAKNGDKIVKLEGGKVVAYDVSEVLAKEGLDKRPAK